MLVTFSWTGKQSSHKFTLIKKTKMKSDREFLRWMETESMPFLCENIIQNISWKKKGKKKEKKKRTPLAQKKTDTVEDQLNKDALSKMVEA